MRAPLRFGGDHEGIGRGTDSETNAGWHRLNANWLAIGLQRRRVLAFDPISSPGPTKERFHSAILA